MLKKRLMMVTALVLGGLFFFGAMPVEAVEEPVRVEENALLDLKAVEIEQPVNRGETWYYNDGLWHGVLHRVGGNNQPAPYTYRGLVSSDVNGPAPFGLTEELAKE
ncbi:hypothetical protein PRVXT_002717 [Proteinivorax tanatarense]|uniref:Uncharacterized protein n=1 Tax=Proteinivorax tanatarense TaxID=1260629 RepID=A0AAU7VKN7_9FIRM